MKKYYITDEIKKYDLKISENDIIEFKSYDNKSNIVQIHKDSIGFYINKKDNEFNTCEGFLIKENYFKRKIIYNYDKPFEKVSNNKLDIKPTGRSYGLLFR